jgi:hypothetical protein
MITSVIWNHVNRNSGVMVIVLALSAVKDFEKLLNLNDRKVVFELQLHQTFLVFINLIYNMNCMINISNILPD